MTKREAETVYWQCGRKKVYANRGEAYAGVRKAADAGIGGLKPYQCCHCGLWHNATVKVGT